MVSASPLLSRQNSINYNAAPPNISTLPAQSLFNKWRPKAHFLAPSGHVGDPMGAFADPSTGLFHQGYLYTPYNQTVGNGAAGATTSDLVHWIDVNKPNPSFIKSGGINDPIAVFDGTVIPKGYQGLPTLIYTSVSFLPISWTLPYIPGSEAQSIAVSYDNGKNFTKLERGPVIASAPFGLDVTGWRDPYLFQNSQFDKVVNSSEGVWYASVSGGVHDVGPGLFLYRQYDANFTQWEYLGEWWKEAANTTWGDGTWAGRWGFNFEVGNVFGLDDRGYDEDGTLFTLIGTEGGGYGYPGGRAQLWASGDLVSTGNKSEPVSFDVKKAGILDWGKGSYAAAGHFLPSSAEASKSSGAPDRFIAVQWLTQDFFGSNPYPIKQQGWDGQLTLPREYFRKAIYNIVNNEAVQEIASWRISSTNEADNTVDILTLGQVPAREVLQAIQASTPKTESDRTLNSSSSSTISFTSTVGSNNYLLSASLSFPSSARSSDLKAGFKILSSQYESTTIYYQFSNESLIVDRSNSSAAAESSPGFDTINEAGKLRLWDIKTNGEVQMESLDLRIIVDNSVLEVYANERFVLSTLVFPWYESSTQMSFYHEGSSSQVTYTNVTVHEGLFDAWPERQN